MLFRDDIYITPSGVHKERILSEDLYIMTPSGDMKEGPCPSKGYKQSQCTPLFFNAYNLRSAGAVIHTHSMNAVLTTLIMEKKNKSVWRITHQEMIKGIRMGSERKSYRFFDIIEIPIIKNTPEEKDLQASMREAMEKYPLSNAVLVERHGIYVWGSSWEEAKSMNECYDYLLGLTVEMHKLGLSWDDDPTDSPYLSVEDRKTNTTSE